MLDRPSLSSTTLALLTGLAAAAGVLVGCYSADFDAQRSDVYYCSADADCLESQACARFRCVDDLGPQARLSLPEPLTLVPTAADELIVDFEIGEFSISESNEVVDGQGKVRVRIDDLIDELVVTEGAVIDIAGALEPGAHRVEIEAVHGDGSPYENPGARDYEVFFLDHPAIGRPQVAITSPGPSYVHVVGEPLEVTLAVRNFEIVDSGSDCPPPTDCDPFVDADCLPSCEVAPSGHAHVYLESDYPGCLADTPINCNGDYALSMRPVGDVEGGGSEVRGVIDAERFETPGTYLISASLQYNDHDPYPAQSSVIIDQFEIEVVER